MPIQAYPELSEVEVSLQDLAKIYDIYREQRTSRDEWADTLWAELDMGVMEKGMDDYDTRLKKMPKPIKALKPYKKVEEAVVAFSASLPLIQSLKYASRSRSTDDLGELYLGRRALFI